MVVRRVDISNFHEHSWNVPFFTLSFARSSHFSGAQNDASIQPSPTPRRGGKCGNSVDNDFEQFVCLSFRLFFGTISVQFVVYHHPECRFPARSSMAPKCHHPEVGLYRPPPCEQLRSGCSASKRGTSLTRPLAEIRAPRLNISCFSGYMVQY